jgi:hypothetical protein
MENAIEKEAVEWKPQGQTKRLKRNWQRTIRVEALAAGKTCREIIQLRKNRLRWRHSVNVLCSKDLKNDENDGRVQESVT